MQKITVAFKQTTFIVLFVSLFVSINVFAQGVNQAKVLDINGDGKTDFHLISHANPGTGLQTYWNYRANGNQSSQTGFLAISQPSGIEYALGGDFDNDGDSEFILYRTDASASYQSNLRVLGIFPTQQITFGLNIDDPTVIGDYNGDGKADAAIFRCNPNDPVGTQCYWIYRSSEIGLHFWIPWGTVYAPGKADIAAPGDYDGDGKNDFVVRRLSNPSDPNSQTIFYILRSSDGGFEYRAFGIGTDRIVKGDFDGDHKTDLCVVRNSQTQGAQMYWFIRYSSTGTDAFYIPWGLGRSGAVGDYLAPGDYNGDGRTDITIWRRTALNERTDFYILPSTPASGVFGALTVELVDACPLAPCEYPVAQFQVH
jgi:FG-GAP-like repeat